DPDEGVVDVVLTVGQHLHLDRLDRLVALEAGHDLRDLDQVERGLGGGRGERGNERVSCEEKRRYDDEPAWCGGMRERHGTPPFGGAGWTDPTLALTIEGYVPARSM